VTVATEAADVETSSDGYAARFAGPVGALFLERQSRDTLALLAALPRRARVLDVGGGHAQLTPALLEAGYEVVVFGSDARCGQRVAGWVREGACEFDVGDLLHLPYADASFDAVLSFRLLPHHEAYERLVAELCRVARRAVVVDYPSWRSVNVVASATFGLKKGYERNTRPFTLFRPGQIKRLFADNGFQVTASRPQFLWPMVLHRMLGSAAAVKALEAPGRWMRLTAMFGSPVIVRATPQDR
jgi:SAM-dependent methyltransferase